MNLNYPLLKPVRILLLPVSLVYGFILYIRNRLFDRKIIASASFNIPVICIGNLTVGGTGKSPMVEYLLSRLKNNFRIAVLSRGYKRKTSGYALAEPGSTALEIGDEPMQFHVKFPDVTIAVGEERVVAIPQLLHDKPETDAILLDDAFQHRSVKAGFNILLTDFHNLFTRDWFLPTGDLRDERKSSRRAEMIVVSKCPTDLSLKEKNDITREISPRKDQPVFFSAIKYGTPYHIISRKQTAVDPQAEVLLVTGIANPAPLKEYIENSFHTYYELAYSDHHIFSIDDLHHINKRFQAITRENKLILTTEKDAVRLHKFEQELKDIPVYVLPIEPFFLFNEAEAFTDIITTFIQDFHAKH